MMALVALAIWPFSAGVRSLVCRENCVVELRDRELRHSHKVVITFADGKKVPYTFQGPGAHLGIGSGARPVKISVDGKRCITVKP